MIIFFDQNVKLMESFYVHYPFLSTYGGELYFTVIYEHAAFGFVVVEEFLLKGSY